ncbi:MAG: DNA polymerase III subunit delta [Butyrivibrio sp.]|nr:DNA polymerase III subunit delta [Butyrivibrio sp.]
MAEKTTEFPVKQRQINEDIKNGTFKPCYLVYGEEVYLRYQNRDKLYNAMIAGADKMNLHRYEGSDINPLEIIDMAETMPFFAERRVIVVENSGLFKSGCPELAEYLKNPAETACFVFVETEVDKRKDMYKVVRAKGLDIDCEKQDERTLSRWIAKLFAAENKNISQHAIMHLLDRVGTDMANISNEVEKLFGYCAFKDTVTEEDIDAVCANWLTSRIFAMTDAIVEKKQKTAVDLYYDLLALKEPPAKIQSLIIRQFNIMLQVKEMYMNNKDRSLIASTLKLHPFVTSKYIDWSKKYSMEELKKALELCVSNDEAVKTGRLDQIISVEMIIISTTS